MGEVLYSRTPNTRSRRIWLITCLSCPRTLNYNAPTCLCVLIFHVPTCVYAYVPRYIFFVPTCFCALDYFAPIWAYFSRARLPRTTHKIYWVSLLDLLLLFFLDYFSIISFKTPEMSARVKFFSNYSADYIFSVIQTPASETVYLNPTLWGFVI